MIAPLNVVPMPKKITGTADRKGRYPAKVFRPALYNESAVFDQALLTLTEWTQRAFSLKLPLAPAPQCATLLLKTDASLAEGGYRLESQGDKVTLYAAEEQGAKYAVATLVQMIVEQEGELTLPELSLEDTPGLEFTSVMVDLARVWHGFPMLLRYVDLCAFYKIKVLHLHFTDDQSYTLPSRIFPKLSTPGRSYTFEQIQELNDYASLRGVQIMPEIDVPGHCIAFQTNYTDLFGTGGIICQTEESMKAMKALFCELCEMFPDSRYVHVGGDEAEISKWLAPEAYNPYYDSLGIDPSSPDQDFQQERLLANFVNEMANAVFSCGKQPVAWEGFKARVNDYVRKDLLMIAWENYYQTPTDLLAAGFKIVNISWEPMYIVTPRKYWTPRNVFDWNVYSWIPVHYGSPYYQSKLEIEEDSRVIGGGLCAWGDQLKAYYTEDHIPEGCEDEYQMVCERIAPLAERTWHPAKTPVRNYDAHLKSATAAILRARKLAK